MEVERERERERERKTISVIAKYENMMHSFNSEA
jgi:hypothetical protein